MQRLNDITIEIKPSKMLPDEIGVFAARDFKQGERVVGLSSSEEEIISRDEFATFSPALQDRICRYAAGVPEGYVVEKGINFNDLPSSYYINHSCDGNLGYDDEYNLIALRDIKKGEELSYDYGISEADPAFELDCACNSVSCRLTIRGTDWQNPSFREQKSSYFYPDMR